MVLNGRCHCGAVSIRISRKPSVLRRCTCSICYRYGALWAYCSPKTVEVSHPPDAVRAYSWNDGVIAFCHCTTCGCLTHYEGTEKATEDRIAVNMRMFDPEAIAGIRLRTFDGADTWKYLD